MWMSNLNVLYFLRLSVSQVWERSGKLRAKAIDVDIAMFESTLLSQLNFERNMHWNNISISYSSIVDIFHRTDQMYCTFPDIVMLPKIYKFHAPFVLFGSANTGLSFQCAGLITFHA